MRPQPLTCPGKSNRKNCVLHTGGDIRKKVKRTIINKKSPKCANVFCNDRENCPGRHIRKNCPFYT